VHFVVFPVRVFHVKIYVLCSLFNLLLLRYFVTSGIRAEGFKIHPLSGRLSAALPGSIAQRFFIGSTSVAVLRHCSFAQFKATVLVCEIGSSFSWASRTPTLTIQIAFVDINRSCCASVIV
jgi:hypothetical protein